MPIKLEIGDLVLCTVDRIVGTTVFVNIEGDGEGSIVFSEVAPGRIRNIRDYVVPKKRIVCKILRITGDRIDLSLRRVSLKEKKQVIEEYKQERSFTSILKTILKEKADDVLENVYRSGGFHIFLEKIKSSPEELEKAIGKENSKKVFEILGTQKKKRVIIKKEIMLKSLDPDGIEKIKKILGKEDGNSGIEIKYVSAGRYSLKKEGEDIKAADQKLKEIVESIEKMAKNEGLDFSILKK
ncbi:MAG: hypothetical protein AABX79_00370 [Nanoarchaeota archaeon]